LLQRRNQKVVLFARRNVANVGHEWAYQKVDRHWPQVNRRELLQKIIGTGYFMMMLRRNPIWWICWDSDSAHRTDQVRTWRYSALHSAARPGDLRVLKAQGKSLFHANPCGRSRYDHRLVHARRVNGQTRVGDLHRVNPGFVLLALLDIDH
jgi:hypothetical protein